ncbi:MAG: hypothetical protein AABY07_01045 [Nanoarchaeota archaeon]
MKQIRELYWGIIASVKNVISSMKSYFRNTLQLYTILKIILNETYSTILERVNLKALLIFLSSVIFTSYGAYLLHPGIMYIVIGSALFYIFKKEI